MKKVRIAVGVIILLGVVVISFFLLNGRAQGLAIKGEIESTVYSHVAEVTGKMIALPVELGEHVSAGQILAVLDDTDQRYALEQLESVLIERQMRLSELKSGAKQQEIKKAQNEVQVAQSAYDSALSSNQKAKEDYERIRSLYEQGVLPQQDLDNAQYSADVARSAVSGAKAKVDSANQQLSLLISGASEESIRAAEAQVASTESQKRQLEESLEKFTITANRDGIVTSKNYRVGDIVQIGYNLVDVASDEERYVVAYLPEEYLNLIEYDQEVQVRSKNEISNARVCFIDVKTQYTPKDMQSNANKNKESVKIKLLLAADSQLKTGQTIEVLIDK